MRLAKKLDAAYEKNTPRSKALVVYTDRPKAPPAASLSSASVQRGKDSWGGFQVEHIEQQVMQNTSHLPEKSVVEQVRPAVLEQAPEVLEEPVGARAQQAVLEQAFEEPEPVVVTSPIDRSEFQSTRDSAAHWSLRSRPLGSYWERFIRDVSIFTIFFAVLVFVILQTM